MRKLCLIICFLFLTTFGSQGQKRLQNAIYAELLGNGFLASVNYERELPVKPYLVVRCGIGMYGLKNIALTIPASLQYFLKNHSGAYWDIGFGVTYSKVSTVELYSIIDNHHVPNNKYSISFIPSIGYRKHTSKNFMWRLSAMPVITKGEMLPYIGISFGKLF